MSAIIGNSVAIEGDREATGSLSSICHILGYISIVASIATWYLASGSGGPEAVAHAERFGIFIGLWAPTFFVLSMKYAQTR